MGLVQHASGTATSGTTVSATFGAGTTSGNTIIVCVTAACSVNPTISSITLAGSSDTFSTAKAEANTSDGLISQISYDNGISGGHTVVTVAVSATLNAAMLDIFEWNGILVPSPLDKTNGALTSLGTSWSSGSTGTLTQTAEVAFACVGANGATSFTITGPSSPWTNEAQVTAATTFSQMSGYQQVSATTALTYSGTFGTSCYSGQCIATFKLGASGGGRTALLLLGNP